MCLECVSKGMCGFTMAIGYEVIYVPRFHSGKTFCPIFVFLFDLCVCVCVFFLVVVTHVFAIEEFESL